MKDTYLDEDELKNMSQSVLTDTLNFIKNLIEKKKVYLSNQSHELTMVGQWLDSLQSERGSLTGEREYKSRSSINYALHKIDVLQDKVKELSYEISCLNFLCVRMNTELSQRNEMVEI